MRFPQEVVVQDFLPTYRAMLSRELSGRGLAQEVIAELVGVSQAQVSKYLSDKVELEPRIAEDPRVAETAERVAGGLTEGSMDQVSAMAVSMALVQQLENRGPICELHEERMPQLEGAGCDACLDPGSRAMAEHDVLVRLRLALRRLLAIEPFAAWVPHVGSNLAEALPDAESVFDVAALPGRLDVIGGRARAPSGPAFGASRHVATVVLAVKDVHPALNAALNVAYRPELVDLAQDAGLRTLSFEADYEGRQAEVADRLREHGGSDPPGILYHEGAFGIEPVAYVLGKDALDVVARTRTLFEGRPGRTDDTR